MRVHAVRRIFPEPTAVKVPAQITLIFWVVKVVTTAGGEATSDFLSIDSLGRVVGGAIEVLLLVVALAWQFRTRRYHAAPYWFLAYAVAVSGTGIADFMHLYLGIPYAGTTVIWAVVLTAVFITWYRSERTLSIHSITTTRRELFYWATVFSTFALGTALGDFTATEVGLGYLGSAVLFFVVILVPALAWSKFGLNSVVAFWCAYVITRPLGASIADYLSKPHSISGINLGDGPVALGAVAVLVVLVGYLVIARPDVQTRPGVHVREHDDAPRGESHLGRVRHLGGTTIAVRDLDPRAAPPEVVAGATPGPRTTGTAPEVGTPPADSRLGRPPGGGHVVIRRDVT